jgi:hypothetical protein
VSCRTGALRARRSLRHFVRFSASRSPPVGRHGILFLAFAGWWGVLEDLFEWDIEDVRDPEGDLERGGVLVELDGDDGLAGDADAVGEVLLGEAVVCAEVAKGVADAGGHASIR